jgi:hypothetical protein
MAAMHRKQNSEIGLLKSDKLLTKADKINEEKSTDNAPFSMNAEQINELTPSGSFRERKSRKQRLTRISESNADGKNVQSLSFASGMKENTGDQQLDTE